MSCPTNPKCDLTSPEYLELYSRINPASGVYKTVFPDCSHLSFRDSDSEYEDSDSDSILSLSDIDLATQVNALMIALGDE